MAKLTFNVSKDRLHSWAIANEELPEGVDLDYQIMLEWLAEFCVKDHHQDLVVETVDAEGHVIACVEIAERDHYALVVMSLELVDTTAKIHLVVGEEAYHDADFASEGRSLCKYLTLRLKETFD